MNTRRLWKTTKHPIIIVLKIYDLLGKNVKYVSFSLNLHLLFSIVYQLFAW